MFEKAVDAGKTELNKKGVRSRDNARIVDGMS
jgi:hypothetical protein